MPGEIRRLAETAMAEAAGLIEGAARPWMRERVSEMMALVSDLDHHARCALMEEGRKMGLSSYEAEIRAGWMRKHNPKYAPAPLSDEERAARAERMGARLRAAALRQENPLVAGGEESLAPWIEPEDTPETRAAWLEHIRKQM